MKTKTKHDLVTRVLRIVLGVIDSSEVPGAEDQRDALDLYGSLYEELAHKGISYWAEDEIPVAIIDPLATIIGMRLAPSFGKVRDIGQEEYALKKLRQHTSKAYEDRPVIVDFM